MNKEQGPVQNSSPSLKKNEIKDSRRSGLDQKRDSVNDMVERDRNCGTSESDAGDITQNRSLLPKEIEQKESTIDQKLHYKPSGTQHSSSSKLSYNVQVIYRSVFVRSREKFHELMIKSSLTTVEEYSNG